MSDLAEVKRVRMSLQDVVYNQTTQKPVATFTLDLLLEDVLLEEGHITNIWSESWEKNGRKNSRTVVARVGDRYGKTYKDLGEIMEMGPEGVLVPRFPQLKGYKLKLSLIAPEVRVQPKAEQVVEDDSFGAPVGGFASQQAKPASGKTIRANGK